MHSTGQSTTDMHTPDLPCAAAPNASTAADEVVAARGAPKRSKASDLCDMIMKSEFIFDAVSHIVFKGGDERSMDNYCGIVVSSVLSKLYIHVCNSVAEAVQRLG